MPTYEYECATNGRVVEVQHKMNERLTTWGELCGRAGIDLGRTDPRARVQKLVSAGFIRSSSTAPGAAMCEAPQCGDGACGTGVCGLS